MENMPGSRNLDTNLKQSLFANFHGNHSLISEGKREGVGTGKGQYTYLQRIRVP